MQLPKHRVTVRKSHTQTHTYTYASLPVPGARTPLCPSSLDLKPAIDGGMFRETGAVPPQNGRR